MPNFQHCGLYFTPDHIQAAHEHAKREPFQTAWNFLNKWEGQNPLDVLIIDAFRYRLASEKSAGQQVVATLQSRFGFDLSAYSTYFDALLTAITLAQVAELVRDEPDFAANRSAWLTDYTYFVDQLQHPPEGSSVVEHIWLGFLNLVSGIILDAEDRFEAGCDVFRQTVNQIRPEGYLPTAVDGGDEASFQRALLSVGALVCMAEAATHAGVDLWNYSFRGISVTTAAAYITYYYYYPDQWRWGKIADEPTKTLVKHYGSFFEIVNQRARPRDIKLLLDEQRPLFNHALGGLTTLTHAVPAKERHGLFG